MFENDIKELHSTLEYLHCPTETCGVGLVWLQIALDTIQTLRLIVSYNVHVPCHQGIGQADVSGHQNPFGRLRSFCAWVIQSSVVAIS